MNFQKFSTIQSAYPIYHLLTFPFRQVSYISITYIQHLIQLNLRDTFFYIRTYSKFEFSPIKIRRPTRVNKSKILLYQTIFAKQIHFLPHTHIRAGFNYRNKCLQRKYFLTQCKKSFILFLHLTSAVTKIKFCKYGTKNIFLTLIPKIASFFFSYSYII